MNKNLDLAEFAKTLAGIYDNIEQSQKDPKDFARINIFFRPLPWHIFEGPGRLSKLREACNQVCRVSFQTDFMVQSYDQRSKAAKGQTKEPLFQH